MNDVLKRYLQLCAGLVTGSIVFVLMAFFINYIFPLNNFNLMGFAFLWCTFSLFTLAIIGILSEPLFINNDSDKKEG